jgi:hypothetical protein
MRNDKEIRDQVGMKQFLDEKSFDRAWAPIGASRLEHDGRPFAVGIHPNKSDDDRPGKKDIEGLLNPETWRSSARLTVADIGRGAYGTTCAVSDRWRRVSDQPQARRHLGRVMFCFVRYDAGAAGPPRHLHARPTTLEVCAEAHRPARAATIYAAGFGEGGGPTGPVLRELRA